MTCAKSFSPDKKTNLCLVRYKQWRRGDGGRSEQKQQSVDLRRRLLFAAGFLKIHLTVTHVGVGASVG